MPPLPDSCAIDSALLTVLQTDATLKTLMPNGVYFDVAPPNSDRFVLVSIVEALDIAHFGGRALENVLYLVKAVQRTSGSGQTREAAARIDVLLEDQALVATGYSWMAAFREERVRYTEVDDTDPAIRWAHRGGQYRVQMAVATAALRTAA